MMDLSNPEVLKLVAVTITILSLITIFISIRLIVRAFLLRKGDYDDFLVFTSYALAVTLNACVLAMTNYGMGTPFETVSEEDRVSFFQRQFVTQIAYVSGFVTVKMSFAVLYLRLLPGTFYRRLNQFLLCLLTVEGIEECMVVVFACNPIDRAWYKEKEGNCLNLLTFYYVSFGIKFVTDVVLFIQPIPVVWKLQLSAIKRVGAILMLSIGLFVCIIAIVRVTYIGRLSVDVTKDLVDPMIWSQVELGALIICASIPSLRPFLRCFPGISRVMGLSTDDHSKSPYGGPSMPLSSRSKPRQSRLVRNKETQPGGGVEITTGSPGSHTGSEEEIFPQRQDLSNGIVVTRDVQIESVDASEDRSLEKRNTGSASISNGLVPGGLSRSASKNRSQDMSWVKL